MKALSIQQPWAWLIVNGYKDIENRSWPTKMRGPIWIHASKKADYSAVQTHRLKDDILAILAQHGLSMDDLPRGGIIGKANIVDCVTNHESKWFEGEHGFVLADQQRCKFVPCRCKLNFFSVESVEQPKVLHDMEYK